MWATRKVGRCCTVHTEVLWLTMAFYREGETVRGNVVRVLGNLGVRRERGIRVRQRHGTLGGAKARVWTIIGPQLLWIH